MQEKNCIIRTSCVMRDDKCRLGVSEKGIWTRKYLVPVKYMEYCKKRITIISKTS